MRHIHPTALIHPDAELASDVHIGPYCSVDAGVRIAAGVRMGPFCHLYSGAELGENVILDDGVVIGNEPQDQKYSGAATRALIGAGTRLREYVTVNRASSPGNTTRIGSDCLIMAYSHVAHDCDLGDRVVVANAVQMGGHVRMGDGAIVSGMTGVHQFVTIGAGAFVGGGLRVDQDVPPFCRALGDPLRWGGFNLVGLRRSGTETRTLPFLESFYRMLYREGESSARDWAKRQGDFEDIETLLEDFFTRRQRTLLRRGNGTLGES
jgi:UDP-N-acetylglucosamine acyltransferase